GGMSRADRARIVVERLQQHLADLKVVKPARINDQMVVAVDGILIVTVHPKLAAANGSDPDGLARLWVNNIRAQVPGAVEFTGSSGESSVNGPQAGDVFQRGTASWYGSKFHGRTTANGESFNRHGMTAAHRTLPFGTVVRVTLMATGRYVDLRINDRGPWTGGRVIDLSETAAREIGLHGKGIGEVTIAIMN
ncbi:MAG: septal ring lytic transglycosylase RlpA family protein, partial [Thermaerobacterales bacterium]